MHVPAEEGDPEIAALGEGLGPLDEPIAFLQRHEA